MKSESSTSPGSGAKKRIAVIIGGGPAGLTAAFELLKRTDIKPIILEKNNILGGLACTVNYKGNRMDIGGHRFFSKSDRVMQWWLDFLPMQSTANDEELVSYRKQQTTIKVGTEGADPSATDRVMLVRNRKSRIYFLRRFFDYPITLNAQTLGNLGPIRTVKSGISFIYSSLFPIKPEKTLADFFTNRFGKELYLTFFKSYTEKVWGVPCSEISAEWGAQRVKGLSLWKVAVNFIQRLFRSQTDVAQKGTETSLIEKFLYPKLGPGQMWETVAESIKELGGEIIMNADVCRLFSEGQRIFAMEFRDTSSGQIKKLEGDYFFSTMPVKELIRALDTPVPAEVLKVSDGLMYRDFVTVGLLVEKMVIQDTSSTCKQYVADNWIYIQEPDVLIGRLQIFNNWSEYLVADPAKVWLGVEYFCNEDDPIWSWEPEQLGKFAAAELEKIGLIKAADVLDFTAIKVPKTYPGYFGTYNQFDVIRKYVDSFDNLYLVGRNGMHKYNNQDHSMLTAMTAVDNIAAGITDKENIWAVNTEQDYHESK